MKKIIYIVLALAAFVSCDKNEIGTHLDEEVMRFTANAPTGEAATRVTETGLAWELNDLINISSDGGANFSQYKISDAGTGAMTLVEGQAALTAPKVDATPFTAYYPVTQASNIDLSGQEYLIDPLLWATKSVNSVDRDIVLNFTHKYVRINFTFTAGGVDVRDLTNASIILSNAKTRATFDKESGTLAVETSGHGAVTPTLAVSPDKKTATASVYVLADGGANTKTLTIISGSKEFKITITEEWLAGNKYDYNITVGEMLPDVTQYFHTLFPNVSNSYIVTKDAGVVTIPISEYISYFWTSYGANEEEEIWATLPAHQLEAELIWTEQSTAIIGSPIIKQIYKGTGTVNKTTLSAPLSDYTASTSAMVMKFTVNSAHTNNNFTIGVRRRDAPAGEYLWSWHIWVTDYNPYAAEGQKTVTYGGVTNVWMDRHLGAYVNTYTANGNGILFYQWGRKDPLPSAKTTAVSAASHIAAVIKAPDKFYTSTTGTDSDFCGTSTDWDQDRDHHWRDKKLASINSSPKYDTRKSIFDPSPLGWMVPVPAPNVSYHDNITSPFGFMASSYWGSNGRENRDVFFPASGYRGGGSGNISDYGSRGYSWSASASSSSIAHSLALGSTYVYPSAAYSRANGFPVRSTKEK